MTLSALQGMADLVWTRHRLLIIGCAVLYTLLFAGAAVLGAEEERPYLPFALTFLRAMPFFLPLLLFVSSASVATLDLASEQSRFPAIFFGLPLTTGQLVLAFMAGAVLLSALLWIFALVISQARVFYAGPLDVPLSQLKPQLWYPLLQGSLLIWAQTLIWMSYRRRWMRVGALLALILIHFVALVAAVSGQVGDVSMIILCALQMPLAYVAAVWGVGRARHGEPQRTSSPRLLRGRQTARVTQPFRSALQAQGWFESHIHRAKNKTAGVVVVALVLMLNLLDAASLPAGLAQPESHFVFARIAEMVLCVFAIISISSGPGFASFQANLNWYQSAPFVMPAFFAALPLPTGDFAWAKVKTAARNMAWLCALVFTAAIAIVLLSNLRDAWAASFALLSHKHGSFEAGVLLASLPLTLALLTITGTANLVWLALIGRFWRLVSSSATLIVIGALLLSGWIVRNTDQFMRVISGINTVLPALAAFKLGTLAVLIQRVATLRLYPISRILWISGSWITAIAVMFTLYWRWAQPDTVNIPTALFTLIVLTPVLGILAAPLALQWNRSR
jgi:hypothetical protein